MSITPAADAGTHSSRRVPRVRHLARESLVLMAFSAATSTVLAGSLLLLTSLGHQG